MKKLKNLLVGFTTSTHTKALQEQIERLTHKNSEVAIYSQDAAKEAFLSKHSQATLSEEWVQFFQRNIGGGPSEFLRDVEAMKADEALIVVHTKDLSRDEISALKEKYTALKLNRAKHFSPYAVEHLTMEDGHDEEIPGLSPS